MSDKNDERFDWMGCDDPGTLRSFIADITSTQADIIEANNIPVRKRESYGVSIAGYLVQQDEVVAGLVRACRAADHAIASVMATRDGITDEALQGVRDAIKEVTEKA